MIPHLLHCKQHWKMRLIKLYNIGTKITVVINIGSPISKNKWWTVQTVVLLSFTEISSPLLHRALISTIIIEVYEAK